MDFTHRCPVCNRKWGHSDCEYTKVITVNQCWGCDPKDFLAKRSLEEEDQIEYAYETNPNEPITVSDDEFTLWVNSERAK